MKKKNIEMKPDALKRVIKASPIQALAELIWNSLDADASKVEIRINIDDINNIFVSVQDNGLGIREEIAEEYFSQLGGSWKKNVRVTKNDRTLHGKNGEGRLKAYSIGSNITWQTVYENDDGLLYGYDISCSYDQVHEVKYTAKKKSKSSASGTTVFIRNLRHDATKSNGLANLNNVKSELTAIFAPYLISYSDINIYLNGEELDPANFMSEDPIEFEINGNDCVATLKIYLWDGIKDNTLYLCKENQTTLLAYNGAMKSNLNAKGYKFSAYLSSNVFDDCTLYDLEDNSNSLIFNGIKRLNDLFDDKKKDEGLRAKEKWISDGIYPYEIKDDDQTTKLEKLTMGVFDICAIHVQKGLPKFSKTDKDTQKFTFKLLAKALETNPKSLQKILEEVLKLDTKEINLFADLLDKMKLSSIIQSSALVAYRLEFLAGLREIVFNYKKHTLERDQLHKILEKEVWVFDENFSLSVTEATLTNVLKQHIKELRKKDKVTNDDIGEDHKKRVDLMLSKVAKRKAGYKDYIVIELKRPTKKIDRDVLNQLEDYATNITTNENFDTKKCNWKFIAVSNELDKNAQSRINQDGKVVFGDKDQNIQNIEMYALTWSEVINLAETKLKFIQESLQYEANQDEVRDTLLKNYEAMLPPEFIAAKAVN